MTPIFFSIIIPTYNSAGTLHRTLESLSLQTFRGFEVIVMDGQSKDATIAIAESFKNRLPSLQLSSESDKGIYDAMNKGVLKSKGEWIYFLGSDDVIFQTDTLDQVFNNITHTDTSVMLVYGNVFYKEIKTFSNNADFNRLDLINRNLSHQAIFFNKHVFSLMGLYYLDYPILADWHFNIKCFFSNKIKTKYINLVIATYSLLGTSTQNGDKFNDERRPFFENRLKNRPTKEIIKYRAWYSPDTAPLAKVFYKVINKLINPSSTETDK